MRSPFLRGLLSRPYSQRSLSILLKVCHAGMNYGGGQSVDESGEIDALTCLEKPSHRPFILFDVGANGGGYLEAALPVLGSNLLAYSFEPQPLSFAKLREKFGDDSRVTLKNDALGRESGISSIFFNVEGETRASMYSHGATSSTSVNVDTVDKFCEREHIATIDLLKIDTEGFEMEVLAGAARMIKDDRIAAIQFEFGDMFIRSPYHFVDFWDLLSPEYDVYRILRSGLQLIKCYSSDLEVYKTANFLSLLRSGLHSVVR